ncbi:MAG: alpha/beta fold hydrolase [Flavobacteriales bacterium]|nr:alpha/beta fold hydrolase [Flavobacteriales bacterium]
MKGLFKYIAALLIITQTSCLRLDPMLFNPIVDINSYQLDSYVGDYESFFALDTSYEIPDSLVTIFTLPTSLEKDIYAVYIGDPEKIATDTVILYNHGNYGHMDVYWQRAKLLANVGGKNRFGVLMIDYSGFGLSEGTASEDNMYEDVNNAIKWLVSEGLTEERFVMYGFSLGTAPTCKLTADPRSISPSKIILEAPFASAEVMVQDGSLLDMPGSYITNLEINNADLIKTIQQPLMWIHGAEDDFVNIGHGELVYSNHHGDYKIALRIPEANHSTCPQTLGFTTYSAKILSFIEM